MPHCGCIVIRTLKHQQHRPRVDHDGIKQPCTLVKTMYSGRSQQDVTGKTHTTTHSHNAASGQADDNGDNVHDDAR